MLTRKRNSRAIAAGTALSISASLLLISEAATAGSASAVDMPSVHVNAGGYSYKDAFGRSWSGDRGFTGGGLSRTSAGIAGTADDPLYQQRRFGMSAFRMPTPSGTYTVSLHFAETHFNASGHRVFSVTAEGQPFVTDLDLFKLVGKNRAYKITRDVVVTDGQLDLGFRASVDNAVIAAVQAVPTVPATTAPTTSPISSSPTSPITNVTTSPTTSPTTARDFTLQPFASTSVWNLPIGTGARFEAPTDPKTANLIGAGAVWANSSKYSHPIAVATADDPLAVVTDTRNSRRSGTYRVPADAQIAAGTDRHMHVISPDGRYVDEAFAVVRNSTTSYSVGRHHKVDLRGSGLGPQNGTRAYGGSAIGGLIRAWEVDPTHPAYTGVIRHPIAIALRPDQLLYTGGEYGYRSDGTMKQSGYVWPATEQDWDSPTSYKGKVAMGTYLAIPPSVDITKLGLTPQGLMLARAYQDYGAYVTDRAGSMILAVAEPTPAGGAFIKALLGPDWTAPDLKKLRSQLRIIVNNSPATPNGAVLGSPRRAPLLP